MVSLCRWFDPKSDILYSQKSNSTFRKAIGRTWLESAKIARKAGHWQTAYSAILQAQECQVPLTFFQSAKLVRASGEPLRALHELDNALRAIARQQRPISSKGVIDLTEDGDVEAYESQRVEAKVRVQLSSYNKVPLVFLTVPPQAKLLRARWMQESERYDVSVVAKELSELARELSR